MATPKRRLQAAINRLALKQPTLARVPGAACSFCSQPIHAGDHYRNAGPTLKAHDVCFRATAESLKCPKLYPVGDMEGDL